ncbi:type VI secretion system-associated protein TagF [Arenibaculum pallidiluteum]|uniref:type VI secretion system-associated protein TagF n=1 Tax=Arenibaculum pallidiluteum TaxID=2812559 RepID=UPI001A96111B|nr:type VI secretion system-associated protein TagF [Arenibaculum pallidiluteum]
MSMPRIGYYGKLPARADFVGRRLPDAFLARWDEWLQAALASAELAIGGTWRRRFLSSPGWRFLMPPGVCGTSGWMGVLRPSQDAVGRCFPFLLAAELPHGWDAAALADSGNHWLRSLEQLAAASILPEFNLERLDVPLPPLPAPRIPAEGAWPRIGAAAVGLWCELPATLDVPQFLRRQQLGPPPASIWWTGGVPGEVGGVAPGVALTGGLVTPAGFAAMVDGSWERSGWEVADPRRDAQTGGSPAGWDAADWDRPA